MADAPNANDELYPIAVLIDELKVRTHPTMPPYCVGGHNVDHHRPSPFPHPSFSLLPRR